MNQTNKIFKNFAALFLGCILALLIIEGVLRIYNPFDFRVKGDKIVLPANKKLLITGKNKGNSSGKFDDVIVHTKNSLGFRGEEPPKNFHDYLTIITIGGSTTECTFLSDGKTWTDILGLKLKNDFNYLWINNAGFDGQSTFGHIVLMEDYIIKLKPKIVLFLVGANEAIENPGEYDNEFMKNKFMITSVTGFIRSMANKSEVFSLGLNLYRYIHARAIGVAHREFDFSKIKKHKRRHKMSAEEETQMRATIQNQQKNLLINYKKRLAFLIKISRKNNINPVLITQPTLYGDFIYEIDGSEFTHGKNLWIMMDLYNDITRQVGAENGLLVIDLATEMPRNSRYYYDFYHYTNEGSEKVAEIIYGQLYHYLAQTYPRFIKK